MGKYMLVLHIQRSFLSVGWGIRCLTIARQNSKISKEILAISRSRPSHRT
jgi:hypothetical protein